MATRLPRKHVSIKSIHQKASDGLWYWWDEHRERVGPFDSYEEAREAMREHKKYLELANIRRRKLKKKRLGFFCRITLKFVPARIHRHFKAVCAMRGVSMTNALIELMAKEVKRNRAHLDDYDPKDDEEEE